MQNEDIYNYIEAVSSKEDELLYKLRRETNLVTVHPRMLCSKLQGTLLEMLVSMIEPLKILEIGTFTGYSAICMAKGLKSGSKILSLDRNDEINWMAKKYVELSGYENRIELLNVDALEWMKSCNETFDLIYIDGDKREYPQYFEHSMKLLNKGAYIFADNVLWDKKVLNETSSNDKMLQGIIDFNNMVANNNSVEKVIIPIRDGLFLIRKI